MKTKVSQATPEVHPEPDYFFRCPECGTEDELIEYQQCVAKNSITSLVDGEFEYDGSAEIVEWGSGENNEYACGSCGYELPVVGPPSELIEWLKNNNGKQQESGSPE